MQLEIAATPDKSTTSLFLIVTKRPHFSHAIFTSPLRPALAAPASPRISNVYSVQLEIAATLSESITSLFLISTSSYTTRNLFHPRVGQVAAATCHVLPSRNCPITTPTRFTHAATHAINRTMHIALRLPLRSPLPARRTPSPYRRRRRRSPHTIAIHPAASDVISTGNEWIALPTIRSSDAALQNFNVLSMHDRGLLQVNGAAGAPAVAPRVMIDGAPVTIHESLLGAARLLDSARAPHHRRRRNHHHLLRAARLARRLRRNRAHQ